MHIPIFLIFLILSSVPAWAENDQIAAPKERRIEEQKRQSLRPTEALIVEEGLLELKPPKEAINREFFNRLIGQPIARKVDGVYAVMVLLGKENDFKTFDEELSYLKEQGYLFKPKRAAWDLDVPLFKGELAYLLCRALKVGGGVHMRLFGVSPRYALFELSYMRIMIAGPEDGKVSGRELAYSFMQAADYLMSKNGHGKHK